MNGHRDQQFDQSTKSARYDPLNNVMKMYGLIILLKKTLK